MLKRDRFVTSINISFGHVYKILRILYNWAIIGFCYALHPLNEQKQPLEAKFKSFFLD